MINNTPLSRNAGAKLMRSGFIMYEQVFNKRDLQYSTAILAYISKFDLFYSVGTSRALG